MCERRINRVSFRVLLGLCLFAMALVVGGAVLTSLGRLNPSPGGDEGTPAHLFQLAILLLVPAGLTFLATADWRRPMGVAKRLVIPATALALAFSALYYMEHMQ